MKNDKNEVVLLRGHHLEILQFFSTHRNAEKRLKISLAEYGQRQAKHTIRILRKITTTPVRIKLVDGVDSICNGFCKRRFSWECRGSLFRFFGNTGKYVAATEDRTEIQCCGWELNKTYSGTEILEKLRKRLRET